MGIPVNTPLLSGNELEYIKNCIETGWISSEGPNIKEFEENFSSYIGVDHGIAVSNGTAALDVAIASLEIGPGDEVILPTFTIISPIMQVIRSGATPVLVDSNPINWNMDVDQVINKITSKTKVIIAVHIYGLPVDLDPLVKICKERGIFLIEDAAEMHGQTYNGQMVGSFGDISTFSFYPNKHITTGEGGMILTNNQKLADRCRKLRNLAFEPDKPRFVHYELGWNYRMTNLQAALGLAQLEKIDFHISRKREIGKFYQEGLKGIQGFQLPLEKTNYAENIYWIFGLVAESEELKNQTVELLGKNQIGTRPFFWCMHEQPVFQKMGLFKGENYPIAENMARCGFYLPSGLGIQINEIEYVIEQIRHMNNE
jgi:perosamine synthetase